MSMGPVLLLNPPSPRGTLVNREGFGGMGAIRPATNRFTYPSERLAEAAGVLKVRGVPSSCRDWVVSPWRARLGGLTGAAAGAIVRVAARTFWQDLRWIKQTLPGSYPVVATGTGLDQVEVKEEIPSWVRLHGGISGHGAAELLLDGADHGRDPEAWEFADWTTVPLGRKRRLPIWWLRGCSLECSYCPYVVATDRKVEGRSIERTLEELRHQAGRHRVRRVVFRDPVFGIRRAEALALLKQWRGTEGIRGLPFEIETRIDLLDAELIQELAASGCVEVKVGVESSDQGWLVSSGRVGSEADAAAYGTRSKEVLKLLTESRMMMRAYYLATGSSGAQDSFARAIDSHDPQVLAARSQRARAGTDLLGVS